ncbi:MAG: hypothetical protein J0L92_21955 [Deltaproteobacteria bacterium]|nr:hypothetical protein [Deltaproteobacteria bacterium]
MRIVLVSWASIFVLAAGCSGTSHVVEPDAGTLPDAASLPDAIVMAPDAHESLDVGMREDTFRAPDAYVAPDAGPVPAFDDLYESILVPRCGRCHISEDAPAAYRPRMTDVDTAYEQLFDRPVETPWVTSCVPDGVTAFRVRAFDPDTSLLAFLPDCYIRDAEHDGLTDEERATVRAWILGGAPREPF